MMIYVVLAMIASGQFVAAESSEAPDCPVYIDLSETIYRTSYLVEPRLRTEGPEKIYIPKTDAAGLRVHEVPDLEAAADLPRAELVKIEVRLMIRPSTKFLFNKPEMLAVSWKDVGVREDDESEHFEVPPGHYRLSLTYGTNDPRTGFRLEPELCRVFSRPFYIEESGGWTVWH